MNKIHYGDLTGLPFQSEGIGNPGWDCYNLCLEISRRGGLIGLPSLQSLAADRYLDKIHAISKYKDSLELVIGEPQILDWVGMCDVEKLPGIIQHLGIIISAGKLIHVPEGEWVRVERLDNPRIAVSIVEIRRWKL